MRVVIDTNCFLVTILRTSRYRSIFDAYRLGKIELAISNEILTEYIEIFSQKMTPEIANNIAELILKQSNTIKTEIFFRWGLITVDYDDNKFVDTAISANALYIVSNDNHFRVLKQISFPSVKVITIDEFLEKLTTNFN